MNTEKFLKVTEIQRFCMHDGPGLRTVVFLKGCPLKCAWCHNPETQSVNDQIFFYSKKCIGCGICAQLCGNHTLFTPNGHNILRDKCKLCFSCTDACPTGALERCGRNMSINDILLQIDRDRAFYGEQGGVTLSGGEPLMQHATIDLLKACKDRGLSTCVETSGYADTDIVRKAVPYVDLFLWDIKDTDDERHKQYTGVSNKLILKNLKTADRMNARIRLRCLLVNGINTNETHYTAVSNIARNMNNCEGVEFLAYHPYGSAKGLFLGGEDNGRIEWIPNEEQIYLFRLMNCDSRFYIP